MGFKLEKKAQEIKIAVRVAQFHVIVLLYQRNPVPTEFNILSIKIILYLPRTSTVWHCPNNMGWYIIYFSLVKLLGSLSGKAKGEMFYMYVYIYQHFSHVANTIRVCLFYCSYFFWYAGDFNLVRGYYLDHKFNLDSWIKSITWNWAANNF